MLIHKTPKWGFLFKVVPSVTYKISQTLLVLALEKGLNRYLDNLIKKDNLQLIYINTKSLFFNQD